MTNTPQRRVFIPQHPAKYNQETQSMDNVGDLSGLMSFGHPIFMLSTGRIRYNNLRRTVSKLESALFDFTMQDYIVAVGDPVAISAAMIIAAVRLAFPHSKMTLATVNWYRNKYRREHGDSIPTEHSLR